MHSALAVLKFNTPVRSHTVADASIMMSCFVVQQPHFTQQACLNVHACSVPVYLHTCTGVADVVLC